MMRCAWLALCLLLPACTIVEVGGAGAVSRVGAGILRIEPDSATGAIYYRATGVGLVPGVNGATLGFAREEGAFVRDGSACRIVIFELPKAPETHAFWLAALRDNADICYWGETIDGDSAS